MIKQAKKLESLKQYNLSAACYIASTHVYDAIEMYRNNGLYKEAIAVAKLRLPPKDPVIKVLFADWAKELQKSEQDVLTATW
jgi:gem associated protein 5